MFLIPTTDIQDDNGVVAFFAEDFNLTSFWPLNPDVRDSIDECDAHEAIEDREALTPVI